MNTSANVRPFVGVNTDRNPQVVIKFRTTRTVSTPSLAGKIEKLDLFVAESERKQSRSEAERGRIIRASEPYDPKNIFAVIEELRQRGYLFTGMVHKILPEHQGTGRHSKIFHAYAFRFELPWHTEMLRTGKEPAFKEIKGELYTLLESLVRDRNMYATEAYANPIIYEGSSAGNLTWLSINVVDYDAHVAKNRKKSVQGKKQEHRRFAPAK